VLKADREVWIEEKIKAGSYLVYVKACWFDKTSRDFVLSSYGPNDVEFLPVTGHHEKLLSIFHAKENDLYKYGAF